MSEKCKLDECSLAEDMAEMKSDVKDTKDMMNEDRVERGKIDQKITDYIATGKKEHERFNKNMEKLFNLNRGTVKWSHLAAALTAIVMIIGATTHFIG